ncbi:MAG: ribulose-phosphate 3-epimerase [Muribaculaceae bacterium]|nr:ribulose-phosphate 3-epimerase [Muribaculaceae bacterium]
MLVSPSLLAADFCHLQRDVEMINASAAAMIHCDVMDGVFVPNISFGFPVIKAVAQVATKPLDVHLMIANPQAYITRCRDLGASIVNVHQEACVHLDRVIEEIRHAGMLPAVTVNPATPVEMLRDIITEVHMVLVMSVNPGFGGQQFIPNTINKVRRLRRMIDESGSKALIEVDGGVNLDTGADLAAAGANVLVAGSSIFKAADPAWYISKLSEL